MPSWKTALLISCLLAAPARAEDIPRQLTPDLIETEHAFCNTSTGYGTDFVHRVEVDGHKDVVLDYRAVLCGGVPEPYCSREGCLLKVWRSDRGGWHKVFDARVGRWEVGTVDGRAGLLIDGRALTP